MHNILLIASLSLHEALRKRLIILLLLLTFVFLSFYLYGMYRLEGTLAQRAVKAGIEQRQVEAIANLPVMYVTIFGMYLVFFLGSLMATLSSIGAVSNDIESGVMQSILARPITRGQLVLGRWLGFTTLNILYTALVSSLLLGCIFWISGFVSPHPISAVALIMLAVTLTTALTVLGSTLLTTLSNGIGVFALYSLGFTGSIMSAIGTFADSKILNTLGTVASFLMPTNSLWLGASYYLQPKTLIQVGEMTRGANPFFATSPLPMSLILWSVAYIVLALLFGIWRFSRHDL